MLHRQLLCPWSHRLCAASGQRALDTPLRCAGERERESEGESGYGECDSGSESAEDMVRVRVDMVRVRVRVDVVSERESG